MNFIFCKVKKEDGQCCPTCVEDCDVSYPMSIVGHDTRCMRQADYPEYEGLTCTQGGVCKTFIGVESAKRCHDMVQASCEDANAWSYRENCGSNCRGNILLRLEMKNVRHLGVRMLFGFLLYKYFLQTTFM